jgi:hypothetical protein
MTEYKNAVLRYLFLTKPSVLMGPGKRQVAFLGKESFVLRQLNVMHNLQHTLSKVDIYLLSSWAVVFSGFVKM